MRLLYKRLPSGEVKDELQCVTIAMCSGRFIPFDLLFYAFIFTILIMPENAGLILFLSLFLVIYLTGVCLFHIVRRAVSIAETFYSLRR